MKISNKMKKFALTAGALALPLVSFAQLSNVESLVSSAGRIINLLVPIVFTLALLLFFWGLVQFLWAGPEKKDDAKKMMIWGVVALFVMATIWGLVRFIGDAFGISQNGAPSVQNLIPR